VERTDYESAGFGAGNEAEQRIADYLQGELRMPQPEAAARASHLMRLARPARGPFGLVLGSLTSNWWLFALRGVLAIVFGVLALIQPLAALAALVLVFGVWAFIDGINALALAISGWRSWQLVLGGLVGIAVGLLTFFRPGITAIALYAMIAAWSIARGILEIVLAIELRKAIEGELWLVMAGIASIVFGVLMIWLPAGGVLALAWLIGVYALVFGGLQLALGFRLHRVLTRQTPRPPSLHHAAPQPT
jgi:uncharacterized membrane protein HdeD (DUF308 family)